MAAYQWAYTFFYLPHALFGVPLFNVLFTAMAEHVSRDEMEGLVLRLRDGMKMLIFILLPIAVALAVLAEPLTEITLRYGVMTRAGADLVARVLAAFAIGLPTFSAFLVLTRAFYALGDTRTPAVVNAATVVLASAVGALLFLSVEQRWAVAGLALGHSVAFGTGAFALGWLLARRIGPILDRSVLVTLVRSLVVAASCGGVMVVAAGLASGESRASALIAVVVAGGLGGATYLGAMAVLGSPELGRLTGLIRGAGGVRP